MDSNSVLDLKVFLPAKDYAVAKQVLWHIADDPKQ